MQNVFDTVTNIYTYIYISKSDIFTSFFLYSVFHNKLQKLKNTLKKQQRFPIKEAAVSQSAKKFKLTNKTESRESQISIRIQFINRNVK